MGCQYSLQQGACLDYSPSKATAKNDCTSDWNPCQFVKTANATGSTKDGDGSQQELAEDSGQQSCIKADSKSFKKSTSKVLWRSLTNTAELWTLRVIENLNQSRLQSSGMLNHSGISSFEGIKKSENFHRLSNPNLKLINPITEISEIYQIEEVLGRGLFSEVRRTIHKESGETFAIKIIDKNTALAKKIGKATGFRQLLYREVLILSRFAHPNVISFTEAHESPEHFYLVMEYCDCGDLYQYLASCVRENQSCRREVQRYINEKQATSLRGQATFKDVQEIVQSFPGPLSEYELTKLLSAMLRPIAYLHSRQYVHRDIKALNFLLTSADEFSTGIYLPRQFFHESVSAAKTNENDEHAKKGLQKVRVVLTDFGMATRVNQFEPLQKICGTPGYFAPEILNHCYGKEVDMWAFGVVTYLFVYGRYPFHGSTKASIVRKIKHASPYFPKSKFGPSDMALDFLRKCLTREPKDRITAMQALQHPWLRPGAAQKQYRYPVFTLLN